MVENSFLINVENKIIKSFDKNKLNCVSVLVFLGRPLARFNKFTACCPTYFLRYIIVQRCLTS